MLSEIKGQIVRCQFPQIPDNFALMKYKLIILAIMVLGGCQQAPKQASPASKQNSFTTFKFGARTAALNAKDLSNWCATQYGNALLVSADPENFYRRLFMLSEVPTKVIIDYGHQTASFMLHRQGNQIEIFTSDNFPACLSNRANFQITPEGTAFRYDNKREVSCDVYAKTTADGTQIVLDLPSKGGHGLSVVPCLNCQ